MTATETKPTTAGLSRRGFLQRSAGGFAAAIAITSSGALLNVSEAWALDVKGLKPETMKTLILVARDIYPHDKVADRYYAIAMKGYDDKAAGSPAMKAQIEGFVAALDGAAGEGGYVGALGSRPCRNPQEPERGSHVRDDPLRPCRVALQPKGDLADLRIRGRVLLEGRVHRARLRRHQLALTAKTKAPITRGNEHDSEIRSE